MNAQETELLSKNLTLVESKIDAQEITTKDLNIIGKDVIHAHIAQLVLPLVMITLNALLTLSQLAHHAPNILT
jgi:hypothetical protein